MKDSTQERIFQDEMIAQMIANGWKLGKPERYDRERALYCEDALHFVQNTQPKEWEKFADRKSYIEVRELRREFDANAS